MAISSLGAGSGVLTSSVIDQLKAADTSAIIAPISNKISLEQQKGQALSLLGSLLSTFQSSISSLSNDTFYQGRTVSGNTSSVNVTSNAGVNVQSFSVSNVQMALNNVKESGTFASTGSLISSGNGTMSLSAGGASFNVNYTNSMTLDQLKDAINTQTAGRITASTLQVGTNDYRLVLRSADTGADQAITISDSAGGSLNNTLTSYKKIESQAFAASTDLIASGTFTGTENLTLSIGTNNYTIAYNAGTTLQNLTDAINTAAGSTVASIDGTGHLVVQSNIAGSAANLTLTDNGGLLDPRLTAYTTSNPIEDIQAARDASFKYNGITLTRSSNTITDLIAGATINLLADDTTSTANISITQDVEAVSSAVSSLVQSYNTLSSQLTTMTTTDTAAGKIGIFNGDNSINAIRREITRLITSVDHKGVSLTQYGIDLNETGTMSFNSSTFTTKFKANPAASEKFFSNTATDGTTEDGIFTKLNGLMNSYTGGSGLMHTLTTGSTDALKALNANKTRSQALLDARYEAMTARFVQYDTIMTRLTNQFGSLKQQISMAVNGTNN